MVPRDAGDPAAVESGQTPTVQPVTQSWLLGHNLSISPDIHRRPVHAGNSSGGSRRAPQRSADRCRKKIISSR
jgi:hypothetical protein